MQGTRKWNLLKAVLWVALAAPVGARGSTGESFGEWSRAANAALDADDLDTARNGFARCLELRPRNATCAYALSCVTSRRGDVRASLDWLAKAVEWGYEDADVAEWDTDLTAIRGEAGYRASLAAMRASAERWPDTGTRVLLQPVRERLPSRALEAPCASRDGRLIVGAFERESAVDRQSIAAIDSWTGATLADYDLPTSTEALQLVCNQDGDVLVFTLEGATLRARVALTGGVVAEWSLSDFVATATDVRNGFEVAPGARAALLVGSDRRRALLDLESGRVLARFEGSRHPGRATKWSSDGAFLALDDEPAAVRVFRSSTGDPIGASIRMTDLPEVVAATGVSHDGALVALTAGSRVFVFDSGTGECLRAFEIRTEFGQDGERSLWADFHPRAKQLVATLSAAGTIACWDLESGELRWQTEELGGNPSRLRASCDTAGTRLFVSGMLPAHVLVADDGSVATDLVTLGLHSLDALPSGGGAIAFDARGLAVLRGERLASVTRFYPAGPRDWLLITSADYFAGSGAALARTQVTVPGHTVPLSCYAAIGFDPKRVRATLHGVPVRPARFPAPPVLALVGDATRRIAADAERVEFDVDLQDAHGFLGFEAELDGSNVDVESSTFLDELGTSPTVRRVHVSLARPGAPHEFELRLAAVSVSGVSSRPISLRVEVAR